MSEAKTNETLARDLVERYRQAHEDRDIERLTALFAADADVRWTDGAASDTSTSY
jgi:hypothetical protein